MLLVFVGQVTASSVITCNMETQEQPASGMEMSAEMGGMDHSNHAMRMGAGETDTADCCDPGASCSMGSCLSIDTLISQSLNKQQVNSQKVIQPVLALVSQSPSSLYRPPIFS